MASRASPGSSPTRSRPRSSRHRAGGPGLARRPHRHRAAGRLRSGVPGGRDGVRAPADPFIQQCQGDPWCYGVFVDNELPWGAGRSRPGPHLDAYASLPAGSPGKLAMEWFFAARYRGDVAAFNAAWGLGVSLVRRAPAAHVAHRVPARRASSATTPASRAEPAAAARRPHRRSRRWSRDGTRAWCAPRSATAAPSVLDLGMRFFSVYTPPAVVRAVAPHVDVVSVNDYDFSPANRATLRALGGGDAFPSLFSTDAFTDLATLHALSGRPVLVGEWFYRRAPSRRGRRAAAAVPRGRRPAGAGGALPRLTRATSRRMPFTVGQHWFQWMDQPQGGPGRRREPAHRGRRHRRQPEAAARRGDAHHQRHADPAPPALRHAPERSGCEHPDGRIRGAGSIAHLFTSRVGRRRSAPIS